MGGGLMQLVAYGAQDIYLTGNPQITFFKVVYRRHTNFAMESISQTFDGKVDYGRKTSVTISRNGDLVHKVYVEVNLDTADLSLDTSIELGNAFAFIKNVELEIGGQLIDRQYGDWMNIWAELTHGVAKGEQLKKLIDLNNKRVYIPLQFSFCRNPGLAIPLIALQYHEVKLNMTLASLQEVWGGNAPEVATSHQIKQVCLWVDYIYLDTDERRRFAQTSHEYLIEQVQANRDNCTTGMMKVRLNFNHPVKELMWVHEANGETDGAFHYRDFTDNAILQLNGHERFTRRVGDYFSKVQRYQHHTGSRKLRSDVNFTTLNRNHSPIYCYSFALQPEEHQPSGTCNMSRIDNAVLELECGACGSSSTEVTHVYAVNYNVLRVMSGMGGLAYSN